MNYNKKLQGITDISFPKIIELNKELVPVEFRERPWTIPGLNHGTSVLTSEAQLCAYIAAYGKMHEDKINEVLPQIPISDFHNSSMQIIDWGCGQGLGTICFFDFFRKKNISLDNIKKVVLIEPSSKALGRALVHVNAYLHNEDKLSAVEKYLDDVTEAEINTEQSITIHIFSNILDIPSIDLKILANKIKKDLQGTHYFFCMGPLNYGNSRIDSFANYFKESSLLWTNSHSKLGFDNQGKQTDTYNYTAKNIVFKLDGTNYDLITIDYYPPKQFHAAYQLDAVRKCFQTEINDEKIDGLYRHLSDFEVQTPFDIGTSIYDDVHPILAVLNNIVTRGLPTKASPFIEGVFESFGNKKNTNYLGNIEYSIDSLNPRDLFEAMHIIDSRWNISEDNYNCQILDSDLEKTYISKKAEPFLRQLLQPQRLLSSISKNNKYYSQRVDFAFEFPYATTNNKIHHSMNGCAIELDGKIYHSNIPQELHDKQRAEALNEACWYCIRLKEEEIGKKYHEYNHLGSEYVFTSQQVYEREFDDEWKRVLQLVLSPIAIARIEKTVLEALLTNQLDINAPIWKVLVIERDVPCAAIAFENLKQMFYHITQLSTEFSNLSFPNVELTIVSSEEFFNSPLHMKKDVKNGNFKSSTKYDIVIDFSILRRSGLEKINFSEYKCKNNNYFNIRSAHYHSSERQIYTSDKIKYKPLVTLNEQGRYDDINEQVQHLEFFLQLLFRKQKFRPGQTPILSRALQNKSVIGLLPTGGGKSLTYQIAVLLQPGIALIIDPIKSLMKDQYEGLRKANIDSCSYINSDDQTESREKKLKLMEQSMLQFVFLSPERFSIYDFRQRLKNMYETGVYFSYGIIDEVHCVSEWGHDFRTTYLHLGRNLYNYVLPKDGHISLFGLTATASFDVLADIERELSGDGAFPMDADVIVRYEYTNRAELQYKIVKIEGIPETKWPWNVYQAKNDAIAPIIADIHKNVNELCHNEVIKEIKDKFKKRVGLTEENDVSECVRLEEMNLQVEMPEDWLSEKDRYNHAGIVFCPHRTGLIGVRGIANTIRNGLKARVGEFIGGDNSTFQDDFINNRLPIMVATKAFGMGIDKPNVRFTINTNFSSSLESFVQEAGRAGRDKKMALATIMYSVGDDAIPLYFFETSFVGNEFERWCILEVCKNAKATSKLGDAEGVLNAINHSETESVVYLPYEKFSNTFKDKTKKLLNSSNLKKLKEDIDEDNNETISQIFAKTIFRMCCIGLVADFTQDYNKKLFRLVVSNKTEDFYFNNLKKFYARYFKEERAAELAEEAKNIKLAKNFDNPVHQTIFKCMASLTDFIYNKTAAKRRQAINDMEAFCQEGLSPKYNNWLEANEGLKDYIYYYFNSKYARENYQTTTNKPYSVFDDINNNVLDKDILFKYVEVVDLKWIETESEPGSAQIDNVKHLYGAVRLLRAKSIEISENPAMKLLLAFCLMFLGTNQNKVLEKELFNMYTEGMSAFFTYAQKNNLDFWVEIFEKFNSNQDVKSYFEKHNTLLKSSAILEIHKNELRNITEKYIR